MAKNSAPQTNIYINYAALPVLQGAEVMRPVLIGPAASGATITPNILHNVYAESTRSGGLIALERDLGISGATLANNFASGAWVTNPLGAAYLAAKQTGYTDFDIMATTYFPVTSGGTINSSGVAAMNTAMTQAIKSDEVYSLVPVVHDGISGGVVTSGVELVNSYSPHSTDYTVKNPGKPKALWVYANPTSATAEGAVSQTTTEAIGLNNHRVNYVYAQSNTVGGADFKNAQFITPILATMRSYMAPHAPLTDVPIPGVDISDSTVFSEAQYDEMNNAGVWVCFKDDRGLSVTRHAVTTSQAEEISEEESAVSNEDNIVRTVKSALAWLRGNCNVTPALVDKIYADIQAALSNVLARNYNALLGPQILEIKGVDVEMDAVNSAQVNATLDLDLPSPYLDGEFTFNLL